MFIAAAALNTHKVIAHCLVGQCHEIFYLQVIFAHLLLLVPRDMPRKNFDFYKFLYCFSNVIDANNACIASAVDTSEEFLSSAINTVTL
jgi:hypothetical protein